MNNKRNEKIKKYGREIVERDEKLWKKRGYTIDYNTGLLEKMNKQTQNLDKLTNFALDSFGIANPIPTMAICPSCKKEFPVEEFDGYECMTCAKLRADVMDNYDYEDRKDEGEETTEEYYERCENLYDEMRENGQ